MHATLEGRLVLEGRPDVPFIEGEFLVAAYQRGYRWGREEVRALLQDIVANERQAEDERRSVSDYFLQPIVVIRRPGDPETPRWELVDGQQRLTTLFLIVRYIRQHLTTASVGYRLTYETRPGSAEFLESLDPALAEDNIDYHHISSAYREIESWFAAQGNEALAATAMHTALAKWVYVFWYEAPPETAPTDLFIRLNRDRIPLTESELVKAFVLSSSGVERREEVAAQWDRFEQDLRDPQLWAFLTGSDATRPTHIDFLLETMPQPDGMADSDDETRHWLFGRARNHIRSRGVDEFWKAVVAHHGLLTGWFKDRALYHRIGYLISIGDSIGELVEAARRLPHSAFHELLVERTRRRLGLTEDKISLLRYGKNDRDCARLLLLMNVETVLTSSDPSHRFSFHAYAAAGWSLEHIHAQRSESPADELGRRAWLQMHRDKIAKQEWGVAEASTVSTLVADLATHLARPTTTTDELGFQMLRDRVIALFDAPGSDEDEDTHGLGNLALLQRDVNSMLNNAVFALKRDRIVELDRAGASLLPCTRNVFLKYYTPGVHEPSLWGPSDRDPYYAELIDKVRPFLTADPNSPTDDGDAAETAEDEPA